MSEETTTTVVSTATNLRPKKVKGTRKPKPPKLTPAAKKAAKAMKADRSAPCACGCGEIAKGGGFVPGHDSKLSGAIKRVIAGRPYEGEREQVAKAAKSEHPSLNTEHFHQLFKQL